MKRKKSEIIKVTKLGCSDDFCKGELTVLGVGANVIFCRCQVCGALLCHDLDLLKLMAPTDKGNGGVGGGKIEDSL